MGQVVRDSPGGAFDGQAGGGEDLRPYHKYRHELHIAGGVVCYKDRAVIPTRLRQHVLETIHVAHQGVTGIISRVEDSNASRNCGVINLSVIDLDILGFLMLLPACLLYK